MIKRYRWLLLILGWLLVLTPPLSSVLLLMPIVPGAQDMDVIHIAYPIHTWRWLLIGLGALCLILSVPAIWKNGRWYGRTTLIVLLAIAAGIHGMVATSMSAEAMFTEPIERQFADARPGDDSTVAIVVTINGQTKAYPVDLIAYHHKVIDTCGGTPIMVTYCTMCHTGRVYSPVIDGRVETFRLVGANHYNAMFEDVSTKSWWYQATGECIAGPRTGMTLKDIPFDQKYIGDAYRERGNILVLQPDKASLKKLGRMSGYARRADTSSTLGDMTASSASSSTILPQPIPCSRRTVRASSPPIRSAERRSSSMPPRNSMSAHGSSPIPSPSRNAFATRRARALPSAGREADYRYTSTATREPSSSVCRTLPGITASARWSASSRGSTTGIRGATSIRRRGW